MASIDELGSNVQEMQGQLEQGGGAQFWAYVSPQNETAARVTSWTVQIEQTDGNWAGEITSDNPRATLQTPGLSGVFSVEVTASGPEFGSTELQPVEGTQPGTIGCGENCSSFVGIVATPDATGANYWTTWDATCQ
jgi:hypothetical protein